MNDTEFCYWLQGFFELTNTEEITSIQLESIKNHLTLVDATAKSAFSTSIYNNPMGKGIMTCGLNPIGEKNAST